MNFFEGKGRQMTYQNLVKQRTQSTARAFQGIDAAREILAQLEGLTARVAEGRYVEIGTLAEKTNAIRAAIDQALIGVVEAAEQMRKEAA